MCLTTFWMHECHFCGAVRTNASRYDPAITGTCSGCGEPVQVKLEWRPWICPICEEQKATDEPKYPPRGQRQEGVPVYIFQDGNLRQLEYPRQNESQRRNEPRFQDAAQFQGAPPFQDAPRYPPFQNNAGGHRAAQQYPAQQGEQRPQYFQTDHPPRVQNEPRRQGRRESHSHGHGHNHHHY
ncbi:hypothetical protein H9Q72_013124 [Fusarium xylarioides]|uniref:Uncharacterized protein n=1 Tax=Fusarium xylarioides TaxID=221167 RepID=A0A9P7HDF7_9HYPO|nr:hypothetical protein H9Q70_008734 [Fusarium xylarioides]KAG5758752.1 hypothetical protein H9Q72_013124 [Fusarium xylarioides]KAG5770309.1 hypothetical protein H9Q73_013250 [Fusarium xylarioides]KAG5802974.1 hypothetical protein H9Q71_012441 [Fusarium xylarioides]KAG5813436.1 hypothetical protein H9Q74_012693 [Fusarium xylarioides]